MPEVSRPPRFSDVAHEKGIDEHEIYEYDLNSSILKALNELQDKKPALEILSTSEGKRGESPSQELESLLPRNALRRLFIFTEETIGQLDNLPKTIFTELNIPSEFMRLQFYMKADEMGCEELVKKLAAMEPEDFKRVILFVEMFIRRKIFFQLHKLNIYPSESA